MEVILALGGNRGDVGDTLNRVEVLLAERVGTVLARSRDHVTAPDGFSDDQLFLNRAVRVRTSLDLHAVLAECSAIETALGRTREHQGPGPRTVDIDLVLAGEHIVDEPGLTVPHPRMHLRYFVLSPVGDIAPDHVHPLLQRTVLDLLNDVKQRG